MSKPNCSQCRYFYVTWQPKTPNGCRRFNIQCKDTPSNIIASAGMGECQGYEPKKAKAAQDKLADLNSKDLW